MISNANILIYKLKLQIKSNQKRKEKEGKKSYTISKLKFELGMKFWKTNFTVESEMSNLVGKDCRHNKV